MMNTYEVDVKIGMPIENIEATDKEQAIAKAIEILMRDAEYQVRKVK
jgi:ribosome-associated translation inhibitor RaiA